jgi:hypothetical protein
MNILPIISTVLSNVVRERLKNKSTAISALPLAVTASVATGQTTLDPASLEGLITQIVTGIIGLYFLIKKEGQGNKA